MQQEALFVMYFVITDRCVVYSQFMAVWMNVLENIRSLDFRSVLGDLQSNSFQWLESLESVPFKIIIIIIITVNLSTLKWSMNWNIARV